MKRVLPFVLVIVVSLIATDGVRAQTKTPQMLRLFREVVAGPSQSTVRVLVGGKEAALGTIISADGWILSKYSELKGGEITCKMPDGQELKAERAGVDVPFDLVMLKVDAKDLVPVEWTDSKVSRIGHWVASPGTGKDPLAVGVISVASRQIRGAKFFAPSGTPGGYIGLALDFDFAGVKVQEILPNTPAQRFGLKAADLILSVNGETVENPEEFQAILSNNKPGSIVLLKITREEKELELKVTLAERPGTKGGKSRGEMQNSMGSKLSDRRAGFPVILQHDSVLKPTDCGGPLVNLDGKVLGINIARAGRTESYAIPSEAVRPLLEKLKNRKKAEDKK